VNATGQGSFTPYQEGVAYGLDTAWSHGFDGSGRTVAVEEYAPYAASDVLAYDKCVGVLPPAAATDPLVHNVLVDGGTSPGSASGSDEPTLDVEELRALAPGAALDVYLGPNDVTGPVDTLQRIATDDTAQAVSISWGICEAFSDHQDETPIFEQMAAQGQTVFAASGDSGSSDCIAQSPTNGALLIGAAVDDPASQPLVTGVGGLTVNQLSPLTQSVWNDCVAFFEPGCLGDAGGGGISTAYGRPAWQVAPGTPSGAARGAHARLVPDLSVMGDPSTGMVLYIGGAYQAIGGTSMGAPLMAALDVVAAQSCSQQSFGLLNPLLYAMGRHGGDFNDVTVGNNAIATQTLQRNEYRATAGFDMASGLGSPSPATFLPALCNGAATATATPATPGATSGWQVTFHTGASAYPVGATVTVTTPPDTALPAPSADWLVENGTTSNPPSAVALKEGPGSTTPNVAVLTLPDGAPPVDLVTIEADPVVNPLAVGTGSVVVTDSVDHLAAHAPLALGAATPSAARSSVVAAAPTSAIGGAGVTITVAAKDASGNAILGARIGVAASGHAHGVVLEAITDQQGHARFSLRDDRPEAAVATVAVSAVDVGTAGVRFVDPWSSRTPPIAPRPGALVGVPAVAGTGVGTAWAALVRGPGSRLVAVVPHGARFDAATLPSSIAPPAASSPSLVFARGWLYATYRSTQGHLVVLRQGGRDHLKGWRVDDLTAQRLAPGVIGTPRVVLDGTGTAGVLSVAAVSVAHLVLRATAPLTAPTAFHVLDLSDAASQPASATGGVAEVRFGAGDAFVVRTTDGRLVIIVRSQGRWVSEDLAQSALVSVGGPNAIAGDPSATASPNGITVTAVTRDHHLDEFVGVPDNWTAETIVGGAGGTSVPAGHATMPSLAGPSVLVARGAVAVAVLTSTSGRLLELRTPGVTEPWAAYDLTVLARLRPGATSGVAALPGRGLSLLALVGGRLTVLRGGAV
jgi:hypothetical protein